MLETQMDKTQQRISTGLKVNSASDDPYAYFMSQRLRKTSTKFENNINNVTRGTHTVAAAVSGLQSIDNLAQHAKAVLETALDTADRQERDGYLKQYKDIVNNIENIAKNTKYRGVNLLGDATNSLSVTLNAPGDNRMNLNSATDYTNLENAPFSFNKANLMTNIAPTQAALSIGSGLTAATKLTDLGYAIGDKITFTQNVGGTGSYSESFTVATNDTVESFIDDTNANGFFDVTLTSSGALNIQSPGQAEGGDWATTPPTAANSYLSLDDSSSTTLTGLAGTGAAAHYANATAGAAAVGVNSYFMLDINIEAEMTRIDEFNATIKHSEARLSNEKAILETHATFLAKMSSLYEQGADNLVAANLEEEAANLNTLQVRQQLSMTSMSLANQAQQNILQLFR